MKPKIKKVKQDRDPSALVIDEGDDDDEACSAPKCQKPSGTLS